MREILGNSIDDDCNPDTADLLGQCVDDPLEGERGNAIRELAFPVIDGNTRELQYEDLILCPYDEDWYVVQVQEGDGLEVDIFFRHADGNIDVRLYRLASDSSIELVDTSRSESDDETVYLRRDAEGPGRYFVQVFRPKQSDDVFSYDMTVSIFTDCFDDVRGPAGEHNDTRLTASTMPPFGERRQVCDYDDDWYRFTVDRLENSRIDLLFDHSQGDLDMALYDTQGQRLSTSATITNNEGMQIQLSPGEYAVRVYGFLSSQNDYVLLRSDREPIELNAEILEATMIPDYRRGDQVSPSSIYRSMHLRTR